MHNFHVDKGGMRLFAAFLFYSSRSSLKRFPISILIFLGIISSGTIVLSKFSRIETGIFKGSWLGSLWGWQSLIDTRHLRTKRSVCAALSGITAWWGGGLVRWLTPAQLLLSVCIKISSSNIDIIHKHSESGTHWAPQYVTAYPCSTAACGQLFKVAGLSCS